MKPTLIILAVLATSLTLRASAQDAPNPADAPSIQPDTHPCLKLKKVQTDANAVVQGDKIKLILHLEAAGCEVAYQQRQHPDSAEGITLDAQSPFRLHRGATFYEKKRRESVQGASASTAGVTQDLGYELIVEVLPDAPAGEQNLAATLRYQVVDSDGKLSPREQSLSIPITVVPVGTHVKTQHHPGSREKRDTIILIALAPLLVPLMLLSSIAYYIQHGQWPSS